MREPAPSPAVSQRRIWIRTAVAASAAIGALLVAAPASAGHHDRYERYSEYERDDDSPRTDFADVVDVRPIYSQVAVNEPRRECYDQPVQYRERTRRSGDNTAGAVVGAIIGGVVGNQFGGGTGRAVATGVGAVVGANIGSRAGDYSYDGYGGYDGGRSIRTGYERQCQNYDDVRYERRIDGYDVTYRYQGRTYHTTMPYDPGERIAVDVSIRPIRY